MLYSKTKNMDIVLNLFTEFVYKPYLPFMATFEDTFVGIFVRLWLALWVSIVLAYFAVAGPSYYYFCVLNREKYFPGRTAEEFQVSLVFQASLALCAVTTAKRCAKRNLGTPIQ